MTTVRVVNPDTGVEVLPNRTVDVVDEGQLGVVMVRVRPSMRPGLDYDLATYPMSWIVPA